MHPQEQLKHFGISERRTPYCASQSLPQSHSFPKSNCSQEARAGSASPRSTIQPHAAGVSIRARRAEKKHTKRHRVSGSPGVRSEQDGARSVTPPSGGGSGPSCAAYDCTTDPANRQHGVAASGRNAALQRGRRWPSTPPSPALFNCLTPLRRPVIIPRHVLSTHVSRVVSDAAVGCGRNSPLRFSA